MRRRHTEQTCRHRRGRRGWDELREEHGNIHITVCNIDNQWEISVAQGAQLRWSVTTQRGTIGWEVGGRFKREGTYVYPWLIDVDVWQTPTQYYKAIILQLKMNTFFKKKRTFHVYPCLCDSMDHFLLLLNNIPSCGWTTVCVSILLGRTLRLPPVWGIYK